MSAQSAVSDFVPNLETLNDSIAPRAVDWSNPRVAAILTAAAKCFAQKGFSATTLAEIGKELGLRKSIVHYYFASKAALIHEVQSYASHKYLDSVREALLVSKETTREGRALEALRILWDVRSAANVGLSIEVWSASRNDAELRRRAAALIQEKRKLVVDGILAAIGPEGAKQVRTEALATLIQAVLDGLNVASYIDGEKAKTDEAYKLFIYLLRLSLERIGSARATA